MKTSGVTLRAMLPLAKTVPSPCWLALRFPHLSLDLQTRGQTPLSTRPPGVPRREQAVAIRELRQRREIIIDANPAALAAGITPGMPATAALGILSELKLIERDSGQEQRALERLAAWSYQYSHQVVIAEDRAGVWLEAGASERLFGNPPQLASRLQRELGQLGYRVNTGSAPTREAAWLAAAENLHLTAQGQIRPQLGPLALARLHLEPGQLESMQNMGFRQLRDLLRLPRKSLTRRFGPALSDYLGHLLGTRADPQVLYKPPERYDSLLDLSAEIQSSQALLFPLRRMLEELCGVLRGGDHALQGLLLTLGHEDHPDTPLELGLQSPSQDPARLLRVLRERIERLTLPAAVRNIRLQAPRLLRFDAGQRTLFADTPGEQEQDVAQLAERIQARLGRQSINGLTGVEDHRPEYSWRTRSLNEAPRCSALAHRPAWLLPRPQRCTIENYEILAGPERIESGWWDGRDCRRDYFIVRDVQGSLLWAFREHKPRRGWYLHGIFA